MKLKFRKHTSAKTVARLTKKIRIRKKVNGTDERPRLCVFRSGKHMYAQVVDDVRGHTVLSASSLTIETDKSGKDLAFVVGQEIARLAIAKNIKSVVFDRNGFIYHGRVKALADGAREAGLSF
ncbi:MAG: 50S ribosomal protein L18 [Bdellovibrio sp.]|jgi:large subunit ribosomal protein L18